MQTFARLFHEAAMGSDDARVQLFLTFFLLPELEEELEEALSMGTAVVPSEAMDDGAVVFTDGWSGEERAAARTVLEAASAAYALISPVDQLDATELLRESLSDAVDRLNARIARIHLEIAAEGVAR